MDRQVVLVKLFYFLAPKVRDLVKFIDLSVIKLKDKLKYAHYIYSVILTT